MEKKTHKQSDHFEFQNFATVVMDGKNMSITDAQRTKYGWSNIRLVGSFSQLGRIKI
jgi:hypothetical protein